MSSKKFVILLCLNILIASLVPFPAILLSKKVFNILSERESLKDFAVIAFALVILEFLFNYLNAFFTSKVEISGQQLMYSLNVSYNLKSINISYEMLSHPQVLEKRELAGKAVNGSTFIDMIRNVKNIISNILTLFGVLTLFLQSDPFIIMVVSILVVVNVYANNLIKKAQYNHSIEVTPFLRKVTYFQSIASDIEYGKEIRINSLKPLLFKKISELNEMCFKFIKKIVSSQSKGIKISHVTNALQDIAVYGILGIKVIVEKTMSIGDFSMYFNAIAQFKNSLVTIITTLTDMKINSLYMGHFLEYMKLPEETQEINQKIANNFILEKICFNNVSFVYPGSEIFALKNVSFTINKGEKISIVGMNGSGKTTIIKLLLRLYSPTEGNILINDIDINKINYEDYIHLFSVVFQDFKFMAFNIRENLCVNQEITDQDIDQIMLKLNLLDRINSLPLKYETNYTRVFDEAGVEFSGGESQKLAIARALCQNAQMVIMDEPTAALDALAEYEIYKNFNDLTFDKTAIYISHRLSSCKFCDKIIYIKDGEITEKGSHNELIKHNGDYASMFFKQAQYYV